MSLHETVLAEEAVRWLGLKRGAVVLDGTVGYGGHAERIVQAIGIEGRLIGFDKDPAAVEASQRRLAAQGGSVMIIHDDFKNFDAHMEPANVRGFDAMLLDLGVSSPQLDSPERGFAFRADGPLDMRMNPLEGRTAADLVNRLPENELADLFFQYGEERLSRRIARRIAEERRRRPIRTTKELENAVFHAVPPGARHGRIHPATRVFQALRIAVNGELESLEVFLQKAANFLLPNGRLVILSFHSLEDRMVKRAFRAWTREALGRDLTSKPEVPTAAETGRNPRARSAKLRAWERAGESA
jgi:16S rRNA (cytosine1402-N4)-methyltransferase